MQKIEAIRNFLSSRYSPEEYPALLYQFKCWSQTRPLAGVRVLDSTPVFANTTLKYINLLAAGAELSVGFSDNVPYDKNVVEFLRSINIDCVYNCCRKNFFDVILDCNAVYREAFPRYGFVELTRSGAYHFADVPAAVVNVDDSRIKAIETCLGTGESFLRAMKQLGYELKNKKVVVMGCGKVGRGVVFYAGRAGAQVWAVDDPAAVKSCVNGSLVSRFERSRVLELLREADVVVSSTGQASALADEEYIEILNNKLPVVVNMGVEDEWGPLLAAERVLNNKQPLNFILEEPTLLRYIDPTMALHNHGALEVLQDKTPGIRKISQAVHDEYWQSVLDNGLIADELTAAGL